MLRRPPRSTLFPYTTSSDLIVLGSRWLGLDPAKAGMPWWKMIGNRFLTASENRVLGMKLSEYHTGEFRSEEHTSELQSHSDLVCRLLLEKKKNIVQVKIYQK